MTGREAAARRAGTEVATRPDSAPANAAARQTIRQLFERMQPEIQKALPKHLDPDRMIRVALTVIQQNPALERCDPKSLLGALMTCTQVGLEPGPQGHVYLVPYGNKVTFIMGYRGQIELARRSGLLLSIAAHTVYENEVKQGRFSVEYGTVNRLEHKPIIFEERGPAVGYYATARIKSPSSDATEDVFVVLTKAEVDAFRARSATQKADKASGPWQSDFEAMAWKTCVRRLERWLPQSPELAAAMAHEETVRTDLSRNVTEEAEPKPAEPFEGVDRETGELLGSVDPLPMSDPSEVPADASQVAEGELPPEGGWPDPPTPEPGGPEDPWAR